MLLFYQASKDYVINQILSAIDDVTKAVENRIVENDDDFDEEADEAGHFVSRLDEVSGCFKSG